MIFNPTHKAERDSNYFWVDCLQSSHSIQKPKFPKGSNVHGIITDQNNQPACLYEMEVKVIHSLTILVTVMSRVQLIEICKTWIGTLGTLANSADPDQMPQNTASDQGLHSLLKLHEVKVK